MLRASRPCDPRPLRPERARRAAALLLPMLLLGCGKTEEESPPVDNLPQKLEDGGVITYLRLSDGHDRVLPAYAVDHPVRLTIRIRARAESHEHSLFFGLVEKLPAEAGRDQAHTCLIDAFQVQYHDAGADGTTFVHDAVLPEACHKPGATFNLWVAMNPAVSKEGAPGQTSGKDYNTQFFNALYEDMDGEDRNRLCRGDDGNAGCVIDLKVEDSPGMNVRVDRFSPRSSVAAVPADCRVEPAEPPISATTELRIVGARPYDSVRPTAGPVEALSSGGALQLRYSLCPAGGQAPGCAPGTSWATLSILGTADEPSKLVEFDAVRNMAVAMPDLRHHDLYAPPGSVACERLTGAGGEDWRTYGTYWVRACADVPFGEADSAGMAADDNCAYAQVRLVLTTPPQTLSTSYSLSKAWDKSVGNSVVGVGATLGTDNNLSINGAEHRSYGRVGLTGWFSTNLAEVDLSGGAFASLVGTGLHGSIKVLGATLWSYDKEFSDYAMKWDYKYSKRACARYNYGVAGLGFNLSLCATGEAGLSTDLKINGAAGPGPAPFDTASVVGGVTGVTSPYVNMQFNASASVNLAAAKGGINGDLNLIKVSTPATVDLRFGLLSPKPPSVLVKGSAQLDLSVELLSGRVYGWAEVWRPDWCSCGRWCPGYPCGTWQDVWSSNLVSFGVSKITSNLYKNSVQTTLQ